MVVDDDSDDVYVVGHDVTTTDLVVAHGESAVRLTRDEFRDLVDQYDGPSGTASGRG